MDRKVKVSIFLITTIMLSFACSFSNKDIELTMQDSGKTIEVNNGEEVNIIIESNPTTGYIWDVESIDTAILQQVGDPIYTSDSKLLGGGGAETYKFKAIATGQTTVSLIHHRSWEADVLPIDTFKVTIIVK